MKREYKQGKTISELAKGEVSVSPDLPDTYQSVKDYEANRDINKIQMTYEEWKQQEKQSYTDGFNSGFNTCTALVAVILLLLAVVSLIS